MTSTLKTTSWLMRLLILALLAAIAFVVMRIVITVTNPESLWTSRDLDSSSPVSASTQSQNFSFLNDPFNRNDLGGEPKDTIIEVDVPETTLNLKMTGRIAGEEGSAILRTADNKEAVYKIDDEVISDVFLKLVKKDYVVLSVNGQLQRLTFEQNEDVGLQKKSSSSLNEPFPNGPSLIAPISKVPTKPSFPGAEFSDDVMFMLQSVSLRRTMENGRLKGFTVKSNRPDMDITKFGFQKGDIITQVDGNDIRKGRLDFLKLFQESAQRGKVEVTVLRNGASEKIQLGAN